LFPCNVIQEGGTCIARVLMNKMFPRYEPEIEREGSNMFDDVAYHRLHWPW